MTYLVNFIRDMYICPSTWHYLDIWMNEGSGGSPYPKIETFENILIKKL